MAHKVEQIAEDFKEIMIRERDPFKQGLALGKITFLLSHIAKLKISEQQESEIAKELSEQRKALEKAKV